MATAAAEPLDDPPLMRAPNHGFGTSPNVSFFPVNPYASSFMFVVPAMTAPEAFSEATTGASSSAGSPSSAPEPARVANPATAMLFLTAMGSPASDE